MYKYAPRVDKITVRVTVTDHLIKKISSLVGSENGLLLGRGSTAFAVALKAIRLSTKKNKIIMPTMSCSALPQVAIYEGFKIAYVDINLKNLGFSELDLAEVDFEEVAAVFIVHQFGLASDIKNIKEIIQSKVKHKIYYIEDVCQSIGGTINGNPLGTEADYSISSFGGDKIISNTYGGGFLGVKNKECLEAATAAVKILEFYDLKTEEATYLSQSHRNFYHAVVDLQRVELSKSLTFTNDNIRPYKKLYYKKYDSRADEFIEKEISNLKNNMKERVRRGWAYHKVISSIDSLKLFDWYNSGCLWRFPFMVQNATDQVNLTLRLRRAGYDISNHYWSLPKLFGIEKSYYNTEFFQRRIINLWVNSEYNADRIKNLNEEIQKFYDYR